MHGACKTLVAIFEAPPKKIAASQQPSIIFEHHMSLNQLKLYDSASKVHMLLLSGLPEEGVLAQIGNLVVCELPTF
jgi:hypothetical protein